MSTQFYDEKGLPIRDGKNSSGNATVRFDTRTWGIISEMRAKWSKELGYNLSITETLRAAVWHAAEVVFSGLFQDKKASIPPAAPECNACYPVATGDAATCNDCGRGLVQDSFSDTMVIQGYATATDEAKEKAREVASNPAPEKKSRRRKG